MFASVSSCLLFLLIFFFTLCLFVKKAFFKMVGVGAKPPKLSPPDAAPESDARI